MAELETGVGGRDGGEFVDGGGAKREAPAAEVRVLGGFMMRREENGKGGSPVLRKEGEGVAGGG